MTDTVVSMSGNTGAGRPRAWDWAHPGPTLGATDGYHLSASLDVHQRHLIPSVSKYSRAPRGHVAHSQLVSGLLHVLLSRDHSFINSPSFSFSFLKNIINNNYMAWCSLFIYGILLDLNAFKFFILPFQEFDLSPDRPNSPLRIIFSF